MGHITTAIIGILVMLLLLVFVLWRMAVFAYRDSVRIDNLERHLGLRQGE